jgi:hypothetical protein
VACSREKFGLYLTFNFKLYFFLEHHHTVAILQNIRGASKLTSIHYCSRSYKYSCYLGLLATVTDGLITYDQKPLAIGRRGCNGTDLNENTLAAVNRRWHSSKEVCRVRERCEWGSVK